MQDSGFLPDERNGPKQEKNKAGETAGNTETPGAIKGTPHAWKDAGDTIQPGLDNKACEGDTVRSRKEERAEAHTGHPDSTGVEKAREGNEKPVPSGQAKEKPMGQSQEKATGMPQKAGQKKEKSAEQEISTRDKKTAGVKGPAGKRAEQEAPGEQDRLSGQKKQTLRTTGNRICLRSHFPSLYQGAGSRALSLTGSSLGSQAEGCPRPRRFTALKRSGPPSMPV